MSKTAAGLVAYCKAQVGKPYWWGTFGQTATAGLLGAKRAQYPSYYTSNDFESQLGQKVHDCVGLIKGYRWSDSPSDGRPDYVGSQDVAVRGLFNQCRRYGSIGTMPEIPGTCVFNESMGHVGVYIGNGEVIEARGHAYGVQRRPLSAGNWSLWGQPSWIDYDEGGQTPEPDGPSYPRPTYFYKVSMPLLKPGMQHPMVKTVKRCLGVQPLNDYYDETAVAAVISCQEDHGLLPDGEVGGQTWPVILED